MDNINIICTSIKETVEKQDKSKAADFGFDIKQEPKRFWIVRFEIALSNKTIKQMMGYDTETDARRFSEGKTYSLQEFGQIAYQ